MTAAQVLEREFLEVRAKVLELAAWRDRLDRAGGSVSDDPRLQQIEAALAIVRDDRPDRAEQVQLLLSLPYDDHWQRELGLEPTS
jgi:hypothetical protein